MFYLIPVKAKWLAWFDGVFFVWTVVQAFLPSYGGTYSSYRASAFAAVVSLLNFFDFLFFDEKLRKDFSEAAEEKAGVQKADAKKRANHYSAQPDGRVPRHRCAVCGRTELDHPELEFRYCSKCNGNYEYCQDHLFTHEHVNRNTQLSLRPERNGRDEETKIVCTMGPNCQRRGADADLVKNG